MLSLLQNQGESSRLSAVRWGLELGTDEELDKGRRRPTREDNAGLEQEEACRAKGGGWGNGIPGTPGKGSSGRSASSRSRSLGRRNTASAKCSPSVRSSD